MTTMIINRITDNWLQSTDNLIPPRIESPVDRAYKLGLAILTHVFGVDWRDANIFHARKGFLKNVTDANTPLEREIHKMRIVLLAEMILNLQDVPGFNACVSQMLNRDLIESTYAELEIARLLYTQSTVSFEFRKPVGVKKDDYDLTITYDDGVVCCAETKCKAEETEITLDTIEHSFAKARRQMPSAAPGIIFVKVPGSGWKTRISRSIWRGWQTSISRKPTKSFQSNTTRPVSCCVRSRKGKRLAK
jgi:hypothetical protein